MSPAVLILIGIGMLVVGLMLIAIECLIPSFGLIGVMGVTLIVGSIIMAFNTGSAASGVVFVVLAVIGIPLAIHAGFKILPRTSLGRGFILSGPATPEEQAVDTGYEEYEGKEGVTKSKLRPSGIAIIENERLTVQSEGEWIEKGARIKVIKVVGNKIFVESV
jgi:membrane-bound serine protease (ClpP class)